MVRATVSRAVRMQEEIMRVFGRSNLLWLTAGLWLVVPAAAQDVGPDRVSPAPERMLLFDAGADLESSRGAAPAVVAPDFDSDELTRFISGFLERARTPSAAVAIVHRDRIVYAHGFGEDRGEAVTAEDRFYLGSCTKLLTALAVMQLADTGFLELDRAVESYLPEFALADSTRSARVTVRQLLSHTSGLSTRSAFDATAQREGRLEHLSFGADPGSKVQYSSLNYLVLGQLVEAVSGMGYEDYLRTFVSTPLRLESTFAERSRAEEAGIVQGHTYFLGVPVARSEPPYTELMVPAGYVVSSAHDMARFLAVFTNRGRVDDRWVLSPGAVEEMLGPGESGSALGWGVGELEGEPTRGHAGMTPGFSARLALLPRLEYGIVLLASRNDGPFFPAYRDLMDGIARRLIGAKAIDYPMKGHWLRLGFAAIFVWTLVSLARAVRRWSQAGRPRRVILERRVWLPALVRLGVSVGLLLWVLRSLAQISLTGMVEFYPDLGMLLILGVCVAAVESIVGVLMRSNEGSAPESEAGGRGPEGPELETLG